MSFARRNDAEPRLPPGSVVADAIVERMVAAGATAVVYRGHRPDGCPVAIKVGTAAAASARTEHRFRNESRLSCAVVHPGIVRSIAMGQLHGPAGFEGRMFVVFPFVAGPTLSAEMAYHHEGMPEARVRGLARQLAGVLAALHAAGIVHRDIKPANLILGEHDGLHLVDFGLAYAVGTSGVEKTDDVTLKGAAPGTTYYMSPQQLLHAEVGPSFDVFGFGATLFELLCGWAPEAEQSEDEVAARRRAGDWTPTDLGLVASGVSEELVALVGRCLAHEVDARPSAEELVAFFGGDVVDESPEFAAEPTMPQRRPPVIAEGAREAGEQTLVKLVRDGVEMPSVRRLHEELERGAREDECIVVPKAQALAAAGRAETRAEPLPETRAEPLPEPLPEPDAPSPDGMPDAEPVSRPSRRAVVLVVVALLGLSLLLWFAFSGGPREPGHAVDASRDEPAPAAVVVEPDAAPEPAPQPEQPEVPSVTETPKTEPGAGVEPKQRPRASKPRPPKAARPLPEVEDEAPEDSPACTRARAAAEQAGREGHPRTVLRETSNAKCWNGHETLRRALRTNAYLDLHDYAACAREGSKSSQADTRALARMCEAKTSKEGQ